MNTNRSSADDYRCRIATLREHMQGRDFDTLYISSPPNIAYLTGVRLVPGERVIALLISPETDPVLVVPALEADRAREDTADIAIISWHDTDGHLAALETALRMTQSRRLAIEKDTVSVRMDEDLRAIMKGEPLADAASLLSDLRLRKSARELSLIESAADALDACLPDVAEALQIGRAETEVAFDVEGRLRRQGVSGLSFPVTVLSGPNTAAPHAHSGNRKLREGDLITLDFGAAQDGYCSDMTRSFAIGEPGDRARDVFEVVFAAQEAAICSVRSGATCGDVDAAARSVIAKAGYGDYFVHRTGHGLGLEVHERPYLVSGSSELLEEGMVVTVEPGIYIPGFGGVRLEDDLVVLDAGSRRLTKAPRELRICAP